VNTTVRIGSLELKNPITVASGTAGYGEELSGYFDISKIGALFTKGLSLKPRAGNKGPRIIETPSGMMNSIGLENVGIEVFLDDKLPFLLEKGVEVIPNIAGHSEEENVELARILSNTGGINAVELNVSCPNVKEGGMAFGQDLKIFTRLVEKVRKETKGVLIIKLSPNVTDVTAFAAAAKSCGADAVSAVNTFLGMKIDIGTRRPHFKNRVAGLSGPAIRPMAIRIVYQVFEKVEIPIIGIGGIMEFEDVLEFMMAGATAIQVGTGNLVDPCMSGRFVDLLQEYCEKEKIDTMASLVGAAHA